MAVFISYHSSRQPVVEHLAAYLARHDVESWYAPRDVPPGSSWAESIANAIRNSSALVLLFCASADASVHVEREVSLADRARIPIYWIRIQRVEPDKLAYFLNTTQWVDWLDERDTTLDGLVRDLKAGRSHDAPPSGSPESPAARQENRPSETWPAGIIAFENQQAAAEACAHVYFRRAQRAPDNSVLLPTGRAATVLFQGMLRVAHQYAPNPFGRAHILTDTETFGVHPRHDTSRSRHVLESLIEPLTEMGLGPDPSQLHLLSGQIGEQDPVRLTQRLLRLRPPVVHGISISPAGEVLAYEVGVYPDAENIVSDGCRIVELSEQGRRYIDPNQPSKSVMTVGLGTAIGCPGLLVLGFDRSKSRILHQMTHFSATAGVPATLLRRNSLAVLATTVSVAEDADLENVYRPESVEGGADWMEARFS